MGRTELIENSLDPEWSKTFLLDYYFEEKQVRFIFSCYIYKYFNRSAILCNILKPNTNQKITLHEVFESTRLFLDTYWYKCKCFYDVMATYKNVPF